MSNRAPLVQIRYFWTLVTIKCLHAIHARGYKYAHAGDGVYTHTILKYIDV